MVLVKPRSQYCLTLPWFVSESEKSYKSSTQC